MHIIIYIFLIYINNSCERKKYKCSERVIYPLILVHPVWLELKWVLKEKTFILNFILSYSVYAI